MRGRGGWSGTADGQVARKVTEELNNSSSRTKFVRNTAKSQDDSLGCARASQARSRPKHLHQ